MFQIDSKQAIPNTIDTDGYSIRQTDQPKVGILSAAIKKRIPSQQ